MKKKKWYSPANMALAVVYVVFIISFSVVLTLNFRPLYYHDMKSLEIPENAGLSAETVRENYDVLIDYNSMFYDGELEFPDFGMSETGRIHFEEVKVIFDGFQYAALLSFAAGAAGTIWRLKKKDAGFFYPAGVLSILTPAAPAIFIALNWEMVFEKFHALAFHNDYWIFDWRTDPVILILPDEFFLHCAVMILACIIAGGLACFAAGFLLRRRFREMQRVEIAKK